MAFSIMCMFLTVLYAGFAALTFSYSHSIIEEHLAEEREEALVAQSHKMTPHHHFHLGYDGYIGERFDVHRRGPSSGGLGFVPKPSEIAQLT